LAQALGDTSLQPDLASDDLTDQIHALLPRATQSEITNEGKCIGEVEAFTKNAVAALVRSPRRRVERLAAGRGLRLRQRRIQLQPADTARESLVRSRQTEATEKLRQYYVNHDISLAFYRLLNRSIQLRFNKALSSVRLLHVLTRIFIDQSFTSKLKKMTLEERYALLDAFAAEFPGSPVSGLLATLFPEHGAGIALGVRAPEGAPLLTAQELWSVEDPSSDTGRPAKQWSEREPGQTPPEFVRANYGVWRDGAWDPNGLTKPDLRHDMQLYNALAAYERRHPDQALNLPTKKQANDMWVERVLRGEEAPRSVLEAQRFATTARRRGVGANEGKS
jgi:hypothetical protein